MKQALFLILMLPCCCFAQNVAQSPAGDKPAVSMHFDKMVMHTGWVENGKERHATVTTEDAEFLPPSPERKATANTFKAYGVSIEDGHRVLTAKRMIYDLGSGKGTLHGRITMTTDGVKKKLPKSARIELNKNSFKVE